MVELVAQCLVLEHFAPKVCLHSKVCVKMMREFWF